MDVTAVSLTHNIYDNINENKQNRNNSAPKKLINGNDIISSKATKGNKKGKS